MKKIDEYPKSLKKAIRYIKQEASVEQLNEIEKILNYYISFRRKRLQEKNIKDIWDVN
ncbi:MULTISPECIES: hypothetical protein [Priestia]|uniref:hypothetical protein n=1 Tax=Priestia TaxID=2800373 RepID=UPI001C8D22A4|nr:hypothetical protein [Priestia aryabhattai]MBY0214422.1 hypothetical protein [Priestia aryabhattai]MDT0148411.1 hypothetical protein [Priestia aryabhattai]MDT0153723.1 hypothetical protein [Priestia aryabhattai]